MDDLELSRRYRRHRAPRPVAEAATALAQLISHAGPDGYEKNVALDRLEESVLWAATAAAGTLGCGPDCPSHGTVNDGP